MTRANEDQGFTNGGAQNLQDTQNDIKKSYDSKQPQEQQQSGMTQTGSTSSRQTDR